MISARHISSILILPALLLASCAKVSSPGGGPADENPPVVMKTIPDNGSTGFNSRSFEVVFNEYFVLDNVSSELVVSPPLSKKPEILTRGMSLIVKFDDEETLHENVTYTFNFRGAIKDLNEGNPLDNYKYVFSTGDVLDTLSLTGYIYDAFNLEAGEDILVMMYSEKADSMPLTTMPLYITKASEDGKYRIDNIAGGEYMLYGLRDENNTMTYDLQTEDFAFADSAVIVSPEDNYIPSRPDTLALAAAADSLVADTLAADTLTAAADTLALAAAADSLVADTLTAAADTLAADSLTSAADTLAADSLTPAADTLFPGAVTDTIGSRAEADMLIQGGKADRVTAFAKDDSLKYEHIPGEEANLYYFRSLNKNQYLTGTSRTQPYLLQFTFSLPVDTSSFNIAFADTDDEIDYIREVSASQDTFKIWLMDSSFFSQDLVTVYLRHPRTDSLGQLQMVSDTVRLRYAAVAAGRAAQQREQAGLPVATNLSQRTGLIPGQLPFFSFSTPVEDPDTSLIQLYVMDDTVKIRQDYELRRDSLNMKRIIMNTELLPDSSYVLVADSGAFKDIYGHPNDSAAYSFTVRKPDDFGKLMVNLTGYEGNIILQLLDNDEKVIRERIIRLPDDKTVEFPYLSDKTHLLKAIMDINGDGEWTTGDYDLKRQPEPVSYYPKKIEVKAGWELIEDWEISGLRRKDESISSTRGGKKK